jgi:hypothetical protein
LAFSCLNSSAIISSSPSSRQSAEHLVGGGRRRRHRRRQQIRQPGNARWQRCVGVVDYGSGFWVGGQRSGTWEEAATAAMAIRRGGRQIGMGQIGCRMGGFGFQEGHMWQNPMWTGVPASPFRTPLVGSDMELPAIVLCFTTGRLLLRCVGVAQ